MFWEEKSGEAEIGCGSEGEKLHFIAGYGYIDGASKKITESTTPKLILGKTYNHLITRAGVAKLRLEESSTFGGEDRLI